MCRQSCSSSSSSHGRSTTTGILYSHTTCCCCCCLLLFFFSPLFSRELKTNWVTRFLSCYIPRIRLEMQNRVKKGINKKKKQTSQNTTKGPTPLPHRRHLASFDTKSRCCNDCRCRCSCCNILIGLFCRGAFGSL